MTDTIAVLGLGRMGRALAQAMLRTDRVVTVWNRSAAKAEALAGEGAVVAASVEAAVVPASVVLVNVIDYEASEAVLRAAGAASFLRGKVIVELSSGTPVQARAAAERARAWGADYLDGAILATPDFIGTPEGLVLYSGDPTLFDAHRDALSALGGASVHVGSDPGRAAALDMALLTQMWGALFGGLHALAVCEAEGVPLEAFETHRRSFRPVVEGALTDLVIRTRDRRFAADEDTLASIAAHSAAFGHVFDAAADQGLDPGIIEPWRRLFRAATHDGRADEDFSSLSRFLRTNP